MKINIDEIKNNVVPRLNNSINYLEQAINSIAACSIPEYFNYEEYMYKLPNNIRYIKNDVNAVKSWAENVVIKFQSAEQKNNGFVSGLSSKLGDISSIGTGATTGTISVNNISLNQQDSSFLSKGFEIVQNIASNISNGINNVAAVVTSMWNSLFGKMTQPGIDLFEACKAKVSNIVTSAINEVAKGINSFKEGIINFAKAGWSKACEIKQSIDKAFSEVGAKISEDWNFYWTEVWPTVWDGLQATGASLFNILIMAPTKGICQFVEAIVDFVFLLGTAVGSIGTGIYDGISYLVSMANGTTDEWSSATGAMWEWTMGFVAEDWVGDACNWIYQTEFGKWLDDHAWDWAKSNGIGSNIASGIGYVAGIIILTIVTMGIGGAAVGGTAAASSAATSTFATTSAVIAASAATGKYTQESWGKMRDESWEGIERMYERGEITEEDYNTMYTIKFCSEEQWNEIEEEYKAGIISEEQYKAMKEIRERPEDWKTTENLFKGLGYGVANGLWEGIQWYIGGKLAGWAIKGSKIATSAVRVGADTAFNGLDTPVRTAMDVFTYGKTWDEAWEEQGGWQSVATNIGIGLIGSAGGEAFDAIKLNKASKILDNNEIFDDLDDMTTKKIKDSIMYEQQKGKIDLSKMTKEQLDEAVNKKMLENGINIIDKKHGYQLTRDDLGDFYKAKLQQGFFTEEQVDSWLDSINSKGYIDGETGKFLKELFDGDDRIFIKTIHSSDADSIMNEGIRCLGDSTSTGRPIPKDISDIKLENTVTEITDSGLYDLIVTLKSANGISQGGNPIDGAIVIRIPKDTPIEDIFKYNKELGLFNIDPKYNVGVFKTDANKVVDSQIISDLNKTKNNIYQSSAVSEGQINSKKFMEIFGKGKQSNQEAINYIYNKFDKAIKSGNTNAEKVLNQFEKIKRRYPNFIIEVDETNLSNSFWDWKNMRLVLAKRIVENQENGNFFHEFGHVLFSINGNESLPENWNTIVGKARIYSTKENKLFEISEVLKRKNEMCIEDATNVFENQIKLNGYYNVDEYKNAWKNNIEKIIKDNESNITLEKLVQQYGLKEDAANLILLNKNKNIDNIVDALIDNEYNCIFENIYMERFGNIYSAVSDLIDAVYVGMDIDLFGNPIYTGFQHGRDYYLNVSNPQLASFHEIIANFTQLKLSDSNFGLDLIREILGQEFYDCLEKTFNKLINKKVIF